MRRILGCAIAAIALVTTLTASPTAATTTTSPDRAKVSGRWIVDTSGRPILTNGVNLVMKVAPWTPAGFGFGDDDAAFLAKNGFTSMRLGLLWRNVEPTPGVYDYAYLSRIRDTAQLLARHGIWVLLDFHQDLYHEKYQGEGAPDWAVFDDGMLNQPQLGFPNNYFVNPALSTAFDNFWKNVKASDGIGLQDHYAAAWKAVATYFASTPHILGVDPFNEPWPGLLYETCMPPTGCADKDALLTAFYDKVTTAVHQADPRLVVFPEPWVTAQSGAPTYIRPTGTKGFSFHEYCVGAGVPGSDTVCSADSDMIWSAAEAYATATKSALLVTEFGATPDATVLNRTIDRAQAHMVPWQYWAYCGCGDPTTSGPGATQALVFDPRKAPTGTNVDWSKMATLALPHPLQIAGTPQRYVWTRATKIFRMTWSTAKPGGGTFPAGAVSWISVPALNVPKGYSVDIAGGTWTTDRLGQIVVRQSPGATSVSIRIVARH